MLKIHIDKKISSLHLIETIESIDLGILDKLLNSDIINGDDKIKLKALKKRVNNGIINVIYKKAKSGYGRITPDFSMATLKRVIRHSLLQDKYIDIDIVNCGATILNQLADSVGLTNIYLTEYINNREIKLNEVITAYGVDREQAKNLFIRLVGCGSFNQWLISTGKSGEPTYYINKLSSELHNIKEQIYISNNDIAKSCKKLENIPASVLAIVIQEYEELILEEMYKSINSPKNILFCNDGITILNTHHYDLEYIKKQIFDNVGFTVDLKIKAMDKGIKLDDITLDPTSFEYMKKEFEKNNLKIKRSGTYIETDGLTYIERDIKQLKACNMEMQFIENGKNQSFIDRWVKTPDLRMKLDRGNYPNPNLCPETEFNIWRPFAMEMITEYEPQNIDIFLEHLNILCGRDPDIFDYIKNWIGQMIQYPEIKTLCPTFISEEGAGKDTLNWIFKKMFGKSKCFQTTDPENTIWGNFTCKAFIDSHLVILSELSKKDTMKSEGKIKGLITDIDLIVNRKGMEAYEVASFHRYICNTNTMEGAMKTHDKSRRNIIIRSSDELIGNIEHFNIMYDLIKDVNFIKSIFEFFKALPNLDKFNQIPLPISKYQQELNTLSISMPLQYLEHLVRQNLNTLSINKSSNVLYTDFNNWCIENGIKYETTAQKLAIHYSLLPKLKDCIITIKGRTGNQKQFNIPLLKKYFKIDDIDV